jgi:Tfp pilus assembly protein PilN
VSLQQINLLNPQLLTPQVAFSSRTIAWMLLAVLVLGGAIYVWVLVSGQGNQVQMNEAQAMRDELQGRLDALDQPGEDGLTRTDKRAQAVAESKQQLVQLQKLQSALGVVQGEAGFSPKLRALAERGLPGVWLTSIEFDSSGFRLEGRALQAEHIPDFLSVLSRQPALRELALSGFSVVLPAASDGDAPPEPGVAFRVNPAAGETQP